MAKNECTSVAKPPDVCEDGKVEVEENKLIVATVQGANCVCVANEERQKTHKRKV